jgi:hypothetical protein
MVRCGPQKDMERTDLPPRHGEHREETAGKEGGVAPISRVFAYEWQGQDLRDRECVKVAGKGLTDVFFLCFGARGTLDAPCEMEDVAD